MFEHEHIADHHNWETLAKINAVLNMKPVAATSITDISGEKAQRIYHSLGTVTASDGTAVRFVSGMFGKLMFDKRRSLAYSVIPHFKKLLENSVLAYVEAERNPARHPNIAGFKNYVSKINIDGTNYYVRFTVQIAKPGRHEFHGAFISDIKTQGTGSNTNLTGFLPGKGVATSPLIDKKLTQWLNSVNPEYVVKITVKELPSQEQDNRLHTVETTDMKKPDIKRVELGDQSHATSIQYAGFNEKLSQLRSVVNSEKSCLIYTRRCL